MNVINVRSLCIQILIMTAVAIHPSAASDAGFKQITGPCNLVFPADHGPHPEFRTEWWYYTGNLTTTDGRRFGFQLTFFRRGLAPPAERRHWPQPASGWRSDQIYVAHAAVSDISEGRHLQAERMARPVMSLAGVTRTAAETRIEVRPWRAAISHHAHRLDADTGDFALDLDLTAAKQPIRGNPDHDFKHQRAGRASCYYSFTRLQVSGTVSVQGRQHTVQGTAWMDHEFSTDLLQPNIIGWDWFSLQLSDKTDIMFFVLRQPDGSVNATSGGTAVFAQGKTQHLKNADVQITPLAYWTSPHSGARYPVRWRMRIRPLEMELTLAASLADQEMRTARSTGVTYWEGSVQIAGTRGEKTLDGVGYVEMTGYAQPFDGL